MGRGSCRARYQHGRRQIAAKLRAACVTGWTSSCRLAGRLLTHSWPSHPLIVVALVRNACIVVARARSKQSDSLGSSRGRLVFAPRTKDVTRMAESVHSGGEGGNLSIQTAAEPEEASLLTFIERSQLARSSFSNVVNSKHKPHFIIGT